MPNYLEELAKRGLKLRTFATMCGVSATHVAKVLRGEAKPSEELEHRMRHILGHCPWCHSKWPEKIPEQKTQQEQPRR